MKGEESKEKDACCENPSLLISMATGVCKIMISDWSSHFE